MKKQITTVCALLLAWAISCPAQEDEITEEWIREAFGLDATTEIFYRAEDGEELEFEEFAKLVMEGKNFGKPMGQEGPFVLTVSEPKPQREMPTSFPDLDMADLEGRPVRSEDFLGRELLVNFFFAECAPCVEETPALNEFARLNPGIAVLAITFDPVDVAEQFVVDHGFEWPIVPNGQEFIFGAGVYAYPSYFLLDKNGGLLGVKMGGIGKPVVTDPITVADVASLVESLRGSQAQQ